MIWLWLLLIPVALVLLAYLVGFFLPERYVAKKSYDIPLPPTDVWQRLHDPERYPMTGYMCKGLELLPSEDGLAVWTESMGRSSLRIQNVEVDEPKRFVRRLTDTVVPFESRCEFWIEPTDSGSRVTCENQATVKTGTWHVPLFRVTMALFGGAKGGIKMYLGNVAKVDAA